MTLAVLGAACGQDDPTLAPPTAVETSLTRAPTPQLEESPEPSPSPIIETAAPEPFEPSIVAEDQIINDNRQITVNSAVIESPGWIVIQTDDDGTPGAVLGFSQIQENVSGSIQVPIDPKLATANLYAVLYNDQGITGVFEHPGPDTPLRYEGRMVLASFAADNRATLPEMTVADQAVGETGQITIESVRVLADGYLALHEDRDGSPGSMLAYTPVKTGLIRDLTLNVNIQSATPLIHAILYEDLGTAGRFDPLEEDPIVYVLEQPVSSSFVAQFPPDIFVLDQPVVDESVVVEKAVSYGPGWVVIYNDDQGSIGLIIGWAALKNGINEQVEVEINPSAATSLLHLMIHEDIDEIGLFDFPRSDPPVLVENRVPQPAAVRIDSGNYLLTEDQSPSADSIIEIPLVIVDIDAWVVVRSESDGQAGQIIGRSWVPAGINRDVAVELADQPTGDTLTIILHLDGGVSQEFEFPDGVDIPLQRNRAIISAPMNLLFDEDG